MAKTVLLCCSHGSLALDKVRRQFGGSTTLLHVKNDNYADDSRRFESVWFLSAKKPRKSEMVDGGMGANGKMEHTRKKNVKISGNK